MRKLLLLSLISLVSFSVHAQTVDVLTKTAPTDRAQSLNRLNSMLSGRAQNIVGLETILASTLRNDSNPINSSFFFKEMLSNASDEMLRSLKYSTPLAIDPAMSIEDLDRKMELRDNIVCVNALNKNGFTEKSNSDLDQLIGKIMFTLALPSEKRKGKITESLAKQELALVALLQAHLQKAPRNKEGKTITQVLGDTHDLDWFGNRIRFIQFTEEKDRSKNSELLSLDKKIEMSLSMLVSVRTRQDEAFVRLQKCLVDYIGRQQNTFGLRLEALKAPRGEKTTSAQLFEKAKISDRAVTAAELGKGNLAAELKFFFEGHAGFNTVEAERNFIEDRMLKNHVASRYLKERLNGALRAHLLLSKLSTEQLDYLINMFLQLNADDLVTAKQMDVLQDLLMQQKDGKSEAVEEAFLYYRQMSRDLTALQLTLTEDAAKAAAKKADFKALEQIPKN